MRKFAYVVIAAGASFAANTFAMKPGLWEITSQMSGGGMPAMPAMSAAERKQMEAMGIKMPGAAGGPMTTVTKLCVTREQAEKAPAAAERRRPPPALRAEGRQDIRQHDDVEDRMQRRTEGDRHRLDHLSGRGKLQG
jgi:hypothetical protein